MDPTKTRIWNADQLGLNARAEAQSPSTHALAAPPRGDGPLPPHGRAQRNPSAPRPARKPSAPPPPPPPRRARASAPPPVPSTLTARWSGNANAPRPLASTRIMPIELLLPHALPQPTAATSPGTPKPRTSMLKRIVGHVLLAMLTVVAIALWKLPLRQYVRARYQQPSAADSPRHNAAAQKLDEVVDARDHNAMEAPTPEATEAQNSPPADALRLPGANERASRRRQGSRADASRASSQRHAVELVIAGDFSGAEQVYRALAREHSDPDGQPFREAARILAARRGK